MYSAAVAYIAGGAHGMSFERQARARAARHAQAGGLALIVVSGAGAVFLHAFTGTVAVLAEPAFVYKWLLIGVVVAGFVLEPRVPQHLAWRARGAIGGSWAALAALHVVAPMAPWLVLVAAHAGILFIWMVLWEVLGRVFGPQPVVAPVATVAPPPKPKVAPIPPKPVPPPPPKPVPPPPPKPVPPPAPKPVPPPPPPPPKPPVPPPPPAPVPAIKPVSLPPPPPPPPPKPQPVAPPPVPPAPPKPAPQQAPTMSFGGNPDLPAMRIMPKNPADIANQFRNPSVELGADKN